MGQLGLDFGVLKESLQEIGKENLIICFTPEEILQIVKNIGVRTPLDNIIKEYILSEKEHIGGKSEEIHTMSLLYGSFFDREKLNDNHRKIMKALQGFEVETLLVDKAIDKPLEVRDLDMRAISGRILYSAMTNEFYNALDELNLDENSKIRAIKEWNYTLGHIYTGQGLDVLYGKNGNSLNLDEYLYMIKESTAKFIQLSLILGALNSGKNQEETEKIREYGINLGIAFQIRDDFYDFENDIKEGKQRIFVTKEALEKLNKNDRKFIKENYRKNPEKIIEIIKPSEIPDYVREVNNHYLDKAIQHLGSNGQRYKTRLEDIAETLRI